jgi:pilus assembly protein Flp/PilA
VFPTDFSQVSRGFARNSFLIHYSEKENTMTGLMVSMISFISGTKNRLSGEEKGATAVEYGIMVALIAVAIIGAVTAFGTGLFDLFNDVTRGMGGTPAVRP